MTDASRPRPPTPADAPAGSAAFAAARAALAAARAARTAELDGWLGALLPDGAPDIALAAVGSHARRELTPGGDLDLVLLHRDVPDVAAIADRIWYPVWDSGLRLDHSVRTVREARTVARRDLKAALGLLSARRIAGDHAIVDELRAAVLADWRADAPVRLAELSALCRERWEAQGELAFLLEPDLKEAHGGLRDVHAMNAVAASWVASAPDARVRAAHDLLLDVRHALHETTGRSSDRLVLQEQDAVAQALALPDADALQRAITEAARTITYTTTHLWRRATHHRPTKGNRRPAEAEVRSTDDQPRPTEGKSRSAQDEHRATSDEHGPADHQHRSLKRESRSTEGEDQSADDRCRSPEGEGRPAQDERRITGDEHGSTDHQHRSLKRKSRSTEGEDQSADDQRRSTEGEGRPAEGGSQFGEGASRPAQDERRLSGGERGSIGVQHRSTEGEGEGQPAEGEVRSGEDNGRSAEGEGWPVRDECRVTGDEHGSIGVRRWSAEGGSRFAQGERRVVGGRRRSVVGERRPVGDGAVEQEGEVVLARGADLTDPALVLRVAAAAAQAGLPLAPATVGRLAADAVLPGAPWPAGARDALVSLLGAGPAAIGVWEALDQAGLIVRLLPEWERVRNKPQRNPVHRFTVDRHLVETAAGAAALTRDVARPDLLLVGALLHDIGKGRPGDHSVGGAAVVRDIGAHLGFPDEDVRVLEAVVRHHLLLPETATRRDIDDPMTVRAVTAAVSAVPGRERETLDLLAALASADGAATGPAAWGAWKAGLVAELARRAAAALSGGTPPAPVLAPAHLALARHDGGAVRVNGPRITVAAPDRPGLLWRAAGVLALHRLAVKTARTISSAPGEGTAVLDFTAVPEFGTPPDPAGLEADLRRMLADRLDVADRLERRARSVRTRPGTTAPPPPRVTIVDDASRTATVIEVRAHDRPGLLWRIGRALGACGLQVRAAQVDTLGAEAVDVFYVVDDAGRPLDDPAAFATIRSRVLATLH